MKTRSLVALQVAALGALLVFAMSAKKAQAQRAVVVPGLVSNLAAVAATRPELLVEQPGELREQVREAGRRLTDAQFTQANPQKAQLYAAFLSSVFDTLHSSRQGIIRNLR